MSLELWFATYANLPEGSKETVTGVVARGERGAGHGGQLAALRIDAVRRNVVW